MRDVVEGNIGDLAACRPLQSGFYNCVAWHKDRRLEILQEPIGRGEAL
jgi:hypothetical protein